MATIEDIYAHLIKQGVERQFNVVAEFCAAPNSSLFEKNIDLVWLTKRIPADPSRVGSLREWKIEAAFEIEGYDVPLDRIRIHSEQFKVLRADEKAEFPCYVPLYTEALHRSDPDWGSAQPEDKIEKRQNEAKNLEGVVNVCDCRNWNWLNDAPSNKSHA